MNTNLVNIFAEFINSLNKDMRDIFDEYFLGSKTNNPISLDNYYKLLAESLDKRSSLGHCRIVFQRLSPDTYVHSQEILFGSGVHIKKENIHSVYIQPVSQKEGTCPNITSFNYEYYTGIVFLLHKSISVNDVDIHNLADLADLWYSYSIDKYLDIKTLNAIYRYASTNEIVFSDRKLSTTELKSIKIYSNLIFGPNVIYYE